MKPNHIGAFLLMIFSAYASADIYQCIGDDGRKTYFNFPKNGCNNLSSPTNPTNLTKKQRERIKKEDSDAKEKKGRDANELLKLRQESIQAQIGSIVECKGEKSCKKAFALTQIYITQHSDMKLQIITDAVLETYNPTDPDKLAIKAIKTPGNRDIEKIDLFVSCKENGQLTSKSCLRREIDAYKQFRPFIEASLW